CTPGVFTPSFCGALSCARNAPAKMSNSLKRSSIRWRAGVPRYTYESGPSMSVDLKAIAFAAFTAACAAAASADSPDFFETRIRPFLATNCYSCHTNSKLGGVRLDSREDILKVITLGDPEKSSLIAAVRQTGKVKMPMGGKLKPQEIEDLAAWVKAG